MSKKKKTNFGFASHEQKEIFRSKGQIKNPKNAVQKAVQVGMRQYRNTLRRLAE